MKHIPVKRLLAILCCLALLTGIFSACAKKETEGTPLPIIKYNGFEMILNKIDDSYVVCGYDHKTADIVIPDEYKGKPITRIYTGAFENGTALKSITIGDNVELIDDSFYGCTNLKSVHLGAAVDSLLYFPNTVEQITVSEDHPHYYVEDGCLVEEYEMEDFNEEGELEMRTYVHVQFIGKNGKIPDNTTDLSWAIINKDVESIHIPKGVTSLDNTFTCGLDKLTSLTVDPENPVYYSKNNCIIYKEDQPRLIALCKTSVIPEEITEIDGSDLRETAITELYIPKQITNFHPNMATNNFTSITVDPENPVYYSKNNCMLRKQTVIDRDDQGNPIGEREAVILVLGCKNSVIPPEVTDIGFGAFEGCEELTSIQLPKGLVSIGSSAFTHCKNLTEIVIPDSVNYLGLSAVSDCESLKKVVLPKAVTQISLQFNNCNAIESLTIPEGVTTIELSFDNCTALKELSLPESLLEISNSFARNTALKSIHLPKNLKKINASFSNTVLEEITIDPENTTFTLVNNCLLQYALENYREKDGKIVERYMTTIVCNMKNSSIPEDVEGGYFNITGLKSLHIPKSVQYMHFSCGIGNEGENVLKSITVDPENTTYFAKGNCLLRKDTYIEYEEDENAGYSADLIEIVKEITVLDLGCAKSVIPQEVTHIGEYAFSNVKKLKTITIPEGISTIGCAAFAFSDLEHITIPKGTRIESHAFYECPKLNSVTLLDDSLESPYDLGIEWIEELKMMCFVELTKE